jgi:hypothetical protein
MSTEQVSRSLDDFHGRMKRMFSPSKSRIITLLGISTDGQATTTLISSGLPVESRRILWLQRPAWYRAVKLSRDPDDLEEALR